MPRGLKGTGSHHIAMKDKVVPHAHFFDPENGIPGPDRTALPSPCV